MVHPERMIPTEVHVCTPVLPIDISPMPSHSSFTHVSGPTNY